MKDFWLNFDLLRQGLQARASEPAFTIKGFLDHIGIAPLSSALRAIDRHNLEHVWLTLTDGRTVYYHSSGLDDIPTGSTIAKVGAGCIAWDGSSWEYGSERPLTSWADVDAVRQECIDAHDEYVAEYGDGWGEE